MKLVQIFLSFIFLQNVLVSCEYIRLKESEQRIYKPFALTVTPECHPHNPVIAETGIYTIPNGSVYSIDGIIFTQGQILQDLIWPNRNEKKEQLLGLQFQDLPEPVKIDGRVAVITQGGVFCYYHFLTEVLGRLAMLEQQKITYDFLVVPVDDTYAKFLKNALMMWGLNLDQIIQPYEKFEHIQATTLIVPSLVDRVIPDLNPSLSSYVSKDIVEILRHKFLPQIPEDMYIKKKFGKKIFISRKDAKVRKIANEDAVFEQFEKLGFVRYELSNLSLQEQICLFAHAEAIVGIHGAGLANIIFSKPGTMLIEIFQARLDTTYCYLSELLNIDYIPIATQPHDPENLEGFVDTVISEQVLQSMLSKVNV